MGCWMRLNAQDITSFCRVGLRRRSACRATLDWCAGPAPVPQPTGSTVPRYAAVFTPRMAHSDSDRPALGINTAVAKRRIHAENNHRRRGLPSLAAPRASTLYECGWRVGGLKSGGGACAQCRERHRPLGTPFASSGVLPAWGPAPVQGQPRCAVHATAAA